MKKLLEASGWVIILMFIFGSAQAQTWSPSGVYTKPLGVWPANTLRLPSDTVNYKTGLAQIGAILYVGDGTKWSLSSGGVQYSDTAAMLSSYQRAFSAMKYSDTAAMLAGYYTMASVNGLLNLKLNISDSVAMLSNYYNKTAVDSRLALKVNYTDTSTMLSPYLRSFLGVKYTDTAAMLSHYLRSSGASYVPYTGATSNLNLGGYNYYGNNYFSGFTTVTASGTLITLTTSSSPVYLVNGSGGQTIQLPNATTLPNGANYYFNNNQSSGAISVNNNSTTLVKSVPSGGYLTLTLIDNSTAAGTWDSHFQAPSNVSWSTNTFDYTGSITSATWNGNVIAINRGGTGSSTQNFVDLTTNQSVAGVKTWNPSVTAASAIARGAYFTPALTAAANNDVLVGLDIIPTFTNGAFTGVTNYALRVQGTTLIDATSANNNYSVNTGSSTYGGLQLNNNTQNYTAYIFTGRSGAANSIAFQHTTFGGGMSGSGSSISQLFKTSTTQFGSPSVPHSFSIWSQSSGSTGTINYGIQILSNLNTTNTGIGYLFSQDNGLGVGTSVNSGSIITFKNNLGSGFITSNMRFYTISDGANTLSEKMRISDAGNLLVGTTTDNGTDKLQVTGSSKFTGSAIFTGSAGYTGGFNVYVNGGSTSAFKVGNYGNLIIDAAGIASSALVIGNVASFARDISYATMSFTSTQNTIGQYNTLGTYNSANNSATVFVVQQYTGSTSGLTFAGNSTSGLLTDQTLVNLRHWGSGVLTMGNTNSNQLYTLLDADITVTPTNLNKTLRGIRYRPALSGTALAYHYAATFASGQVGIGTETPVASSILEISSTTQGFLPPRMTTTQKTAISSPATGLIVFDTTLAKLCVYTGSAWETVTSL